MDNQSDNTDNKNVAIIGTVLGSIMGVIAALLFYTIIGGSFLLCISCVSPTPTPTPTPSVIVTRTPQINNATKTPVISNATKTPINFPTKTPIKNGTIVVLPTKNPTKTSIPPVPSAVITVPIPIPSSVSTIPNPINTP